MGERPVDTALGTARHGNDLDLDDEVRRIAEQVLRVAGARSVLISAVHDSHDGDHGLRIIAMTGADADGEIAGDTWRRADLDRSLLAAQLHGRLHFTPRRSVPYVELPDGNPSDVSGDGTLLALLRDADGTIIGVISADGPVEPTALGVTACELLEVYADQARLALHHLSERDRLSERLRLAEGSRAVVRRATDCRGLPEALESMAASVVELLDLRGAWITVGHGSGADVAAASCPAELVDLLRPDLGTDVESVVAASVAGERLLTEDDDEVLAKLGVHVGHARVLLVAFGHGSANRGALTLFRDDEDAPWSRSERETVLVLSRDVSEMLDEVADRAHGRRLVAELRDLDSYKRDMVASISHDLKSPLTSITLNAELLDGHAGVPGARHVIAIRRSAERLGLLVDDLLALARAEETPTGPPPEVDVAGLVREACHQVVVEAHERGIILDVELPETLSLAVDGDALQRVFAQIVANAVKFSLAGGQVRVSLSRVGDSAEFVCADDGIGIAAADHGAVFDMFTRAEDPRARVVPGTGMGLAIAQRIVSRLGGTIQVDSVKGAGATFRVSIPAATA